MEWLERYEAVGAYNRWTAGYLASNFGMYLDGSARKWYNCTQLPNLWTDTPEVPADPDNGVAFTARVLGLRMRFLEEFQPLNYALCQENKLRHRKQGLDEPATAYYYDILNLCRLVNPTMTEVSKLDYLFRGLKSSLLEKVYPMKPKNCKEFLEFMKSHSEASMMANRKSWSASVLASEKNTTALAVANVTTRDQPTTTAVRDEIIKILKEVHQMIQTEMKEDADAEDDDGE